MSIEQATKHFVELIVEQSAGMNATQQAGFAAVEAAKDASEEDVRACLTSLSDAMAKLKHFRGAFVANVAGAIIENGHAPDPIENAIASKAKELFPLARQAVDACVELDPNLESEDGAEGFEAALEKLQETNRDLVAAWHALEFMWPPAIVVLSMKSSLRQDLSSIREDAARVAQFGASGQWVSLILGVLDNEPFVAIQPESGLGVEGTLSGIVDNFQLNMLLMDQFPGAAEPRLSEEAAGIARGIGEQQSEEVVVAPWDLMTYKAFDSSGNLTEDGPAGSHDNWIWNEGNPADIPVYEGRRVIVIGPATYPRSFQAQRMFYRLQAELAVEKELTSAEVASLIQNLANASSAS